MVSPGRWLISFLPQSLLVLLLLSFIKTATATSNTSATTRYVQYTEPDGATVYLADNRQPALYTEGFGDCQGSTNPAINVTRFDAAYYKDNMTVIFHLTGNAGIQNASLMLFIGVYAYGENRFDLTFNPCNANIYSLCPTNISVPIEASGIIPVSVADVAGIPPIALSIPDFEGQAILRIFENSTQSQIGCYSAVVTNGSTFSQPAAVGTILGLFTLLAVVCSIAITIYGDNTTETRTHYAHSLSVFVVFSVLQHIFFTGALSMNWPSVLVAFWSNYAWAAGMIYNSGMQTSINNFIGSNRGNASVVGAAITGETAKNLGGGYQLSQIYKRNAPALESSWKHKMVEHALSKRAIADASTGFSWYGKPVHPGLPLPGNFSGFAGTLGQEGIPASNAFLTGFLWFLILILLVAASIVGLKWVIEGLAKVNIVKTRRFGLFRRHWLRFAALAVARMFFIAFFMFMFLTTFQFTLGGAAGNTALAAIVFLIFLAVMFGESVHALWYRLRHRQFGPDQLHVERKRAGFMPWYGVTRTSKLNEEQNKEKIFAGTAPWYGFKETESSASHPQVHEDEDYIVKFGWLASRFRKSKWWFFSFWLMYELIRACFYGGAAGHALTQVFGLLVVEIIALFAIVLMKPFEGNRLNVLMVYLLGFSKVACVALSSAFDQRFNLGRIMCTVIGIVIIVIQGILTIALLIAITLGAISTYMSLTRNKEQFKPQKWAHSRARYFDHINHKASDKPRPPPPPPSPMPEVPKEPYFSVSTVRREPKIEDDDQEEGDDYEQYRNQLQAEAEASRTSLPRGNTRASRAISIRSTHSNLPFGAKQHRASWSSRDFQQLHYKPPDQQINPRMSIDIMPEASRHRTASVRLPGRNETPPTGLTNESPNTNQSNDRTHRTTNSTGGM